MSARVTALVADDEPLLREAMVRLLATAWPELEVVAQARNGREAIEMFEVLKPQVCFLDVQMPGVTGVEVAQHIGTSAHVVFVTAFQEYAVKAFEQGALDYLVKPVEPARLAETVKRLKARVAASQPALNTELLVQQLAKAMSQSAAPEKLRWVRASIADTVRMIAVDDIDFLRSEDKYTVVAYRDGGKTAEALIRTSLKELLEQLDGKQFAQVHRSVVVNLSAVSHVVRGDNDTAEAHLKGRSGTAPVSRNYLHVFRQM